MSWLNGLLPTPGASTPLERRVKERKPTRLPRLTPEEARAVRAKYAAGGISQAALGREYGVSHTVIQRITSNKNYKGGVG